MIAFVWDDLEINTNRKRRCRRNFSGNNFILFH